MKTNLLIATIMATLFALACSPDMPDDNLSNNKTQGNITYPIEDSRPPAETVQIKYAGKGFTKVSTFSGVHDLQWEEINRSAFRFEVSTSIPAMEQCTDFVYDDWVASMESILDKMRKSHAESVWRDFSYQYLYDTLESISLTADKNLRGRTAGEELIDLFYITSSGLQFTYPEADVVVTEEFVTVDEWVKQDLLLPVPFGLVPIVPFAEDEFQEEINFTINIVLANSGPVLECTFKRTFEL